MAPFDYVPPIEVVLIARILRDLATEEEIQSIPSSQKLVMQHPFPIGRIPIAFGYWESIRHISPFLKNYIEALEPGVHRFLPIHIESEVPINGSLEHGIHYILLPPPLIDCVVVEETRFKKGYGLEGWAKGLNGVGGGGLSEGGPCTLRRESIHSRHLWRTKLGKRYYTMASDEFWRGICHEPHAWGARIKCTISPKHDVRIH